MSHSYFVYILSNPTQMFYVGVTNNLERRIHEHRNEIIAGFTQKYKLKKLVYYETTPDINAAIAREKQLKGWTRSKKIRLVLQINPDFRDLDPSTGSG